MNMPNARRIAELFGDNDRPTASDVVYRTAQSTGPLGGQKVVILNGVRHGFLQSGRPGEFHNDNSFSIGYRFGEKIRTEFKRLGIRPTIIRLY